MDLLNATFWMLHTIFAGLWTGGVVLFVWAVLPLARQGTLTRETFVSTTGKLTTLSRASALVLFVTGSHMAAQQYTGASLTGSSSGHLVLAMLTLWLVLIATIEIGASKIRSGTDEGKLREPAHNARLFFQIAGLSAILLLVTAGLLSAANLGYFSLY